MERKKLKVIDVKPVQQLTKVQKLAFKASDGEKELWYFTFRPALFDVIKPMSTFEADVEISQHEYQGEMQTDRKVQEIYINGQGVAAKAGQGKKAWVGKSIEERAEIAAQVAVKEVGLCWREGKLEDSDPLVVTYRRKCADWMAANVTVTQASPGTPPAVKSETPPGAPKSTQTTPADMTWDTFMAIAKKGLDFEGVAQVCSALSTNDNPVKKLADWKGIKEEALNELASLCGKDWREAAKESEIVL